MTVSPVQEHDRQPYVARPWRPEQQEAMGPQLPRAIVTAAGVEFRRWHPPGATRLTETTPAASRILREYYRGGVGLTVGDEQLRSEQYQSAHPWSAVFISYLMRTSGAGGAFPYSTAHQTYIRAARRNRLDRRTDNPFWAYRANEIAVRAGDLVCASRSGSGATYDNVGDPRRRATHCDVVTRVMPGKIHVVGGNVSQSVGLKSLRTRPDGRLDLSGDQSRFFAVISSSGPRQVVAAAAPAARPGPSAVGLDARVVRVMDLLVRRYGYPVNGAAGLVGNLVAESGLIPERIEGSAESAPLQARDFAGRLRTFTPEEVRDRDPARGLGPKLPGVGLAQWTSRDRRTGLFRHSFAGRIPGAAILSDVEAQVDYLVHELRSPGYRQVQTVLQTPGVSVDAASDVVLHRFERPAVVVNLPPTDPEVQRTVARRRALGARALVTYSGPRP